MTKQITINIGDHKPPVFQYKFLKTSDYGDFDCPVAFRKAVEASVECAREHERNCTLCMTTLFLEDYTNSESLLPTWETVNSETGKVLDKEQQPFWSDEDYDNAETRAIHKVEWTKGLLGFDAPDTLQLYYTGKDCNWSEVEQSMVALLEGQSPSYKFTDNLKKLGDL